MLLASRKFGLYSVVLIGWMEGTLLAARFDAISVAAVAGAITLGDLLAPLLSFRQLLYAGSSLVAATLGAALLFTLPQTNGWISFGLVAALLLAAWIKDAAQTGVHGNRPNMARDQGVTGTDATLEIAGTTFPRARANTAQTPLGASLIAFFSRTASCQDQQQTRPFPLPSAAILSFCLGLSFAELPTTWHPMPWPLLIGISSATAGVSLVIVRNLARFRESRMIPGLVGTLLTVATITRLWHPLIWAEPWVILTILSLLVLTILKSSTKWEWRQPCLRLLFLALMLIGGRLAPLYPTAQKHPLVVSVIGFWLIIAALTSARTGVLIPPHTEPPPNAFDTLTRQERRIADLLLRGYSNHEIMEELYISINTLKTHLRNIYRKTKTKDRHDLIHLARISGPV